MNSPQPDDENNPYVKTILILAANPAGTSRLQLDKEIREIDEGLKRANQREQFKLEQKWAVRQRDFYRAILDYQPQIVHFSGHGTGIGDFQEINYSTKNQNPELDNNNNHFQGIRGGCRWQPPLIP